MFSVVFSIVIDFGAFFDFWFDDFLKVTVLGLVISYKYISKEWYLVSHSTKY
jgi:hypothetical protein